MKRRSAAFNALVKIEDEDEFEDDNEKAHKHPDPLRAGACRNKVKLHGDAIGIGKSPSHFFGVCEPLIKHSPFAERGEGFYSEWPRINFPDAVGLVPLTQEQIHMFGAENRDIGELEFCGSASTEFQRKQVPNSNQITMISKHVTGDCVFEQQIALQRFARFILMLSLCLEEMINRRTIRIRWMSVKSLAQVAEVK